MPTLHHYATTELTQPTGSLISDPTSDSGQVWQVTNTIDWGVRPPVSPGLIRLRFHLKRTSAASSAGLITETDGATTEQTPININDLPEAGVWYVVERVVRYGAGGYWLALSGTWPGLLLDWVDVLTLDEPVYVTHALPDRLRYDAGQSGVVQVGVVNTTSVPQSVTLRVRTETGLSGGRVGKSQTLSLAVPSSADRVSGADEISVSLPLPQLAQFGNTVIVDALQGSSVVSSARDICICHDEALRVSQYYGWPFPNSYTDVGATANLATMRRMYYGITEMYFWAPCDNSDLAPSESIWRSGQTRRRMGKAPLQAAIAAGHAQGLWFSAYADRWGFGWRVFKAAQKYPDLFEHEVGTLPTHSYDVASLEAQEAADQGDDDTLPSTGMLPAAWGNPASVALHIAQLQASYRMFGWDVFRHDHGAPIEDPIIDACGRQLPLPGWSDAQALRAIRDGFRAVNPRGIIGNNCGWNTEARSLPYATDFYTAQVERGNFALMEGDTNGQARAHGAWSDEAALLAEAGRNAARYGGHQVCIIDPNLRGDDHFFQASLTAAGGNHLAYGVRDELRPLMQVLARHGDLFYAPDVTVADSSAVRVSAPVLWTPYVRYRAVSPRSRQYYVHLFNVPAGNMGDGAPAASPQNNVTVTFVLPTGWSASDAYVITPDGGYSLGSLTLTKIGPSRYTVTLPKLLRYSLVVCEASGPNQPAPRQRLANARTAPTPQLTNATGVLLVGGAPVLVLPETEPPPRRVSEFSVPGSSTYTEAGNAYLRLGGTPLDLGYAPPIPRPGRYRLSVRAKSLVTPPSGAALTGLIESAMNSATPSASPVQTQTTWTAAQFPVGQWVTLTLDGNLTYPNFWCALQSGWDGLVLDTIALRRISELDRATLAATITDGWGGQAVNTSSTSALVCGGLYYADSGIVAALQGRGLTVTMSKASRFRGAVALAPAFPTTPAALAAYRVVALHSIEARTSTPQQQLWLDHYVRGGGILVLLGGVYGFGCGGWGDDALRSGLLPVVVSAAYGDLRNVNAALTPVSALASSVSWSAPPTVPWCHNLSAAAGSTVECSVGGVPAVVSMALGSGRVVAVGVAPLGAASAPYWAWGQWTGLLGKLIMGS